MASPFDDPTNPFQDPSITSALNSQQHHPSEQHTSYELDQKTQVENDFITTSDTTFHQVKDIHDPFTQPTSSSSNTDIQQREESLRKKEQELADREREFEERERRRAGGGGPKNFPPCFPIMYLDISVEIPPEHQSTVWWIYREWLLFEITLVLNFIACICVLFSKPPSIDYAPTNLGVALTEMFTHTLASFFLWYRPVYNAYMKEISLYYFFFFIFNGFHIAYTFYKLVGIPNTGGAGLILLVALFTDGFIVSGIFTLLATICWFVMGILAVYLFKKTYDHYKAAGHTFNEAKQDAILQLGKSDVARGAAIHAAKQSVRG